MSKIKQTIFAGLNLLDVFLSKKRASILLYHSVEDNESYLAVRPENFAAQMKYLKDNRYKVIGLHELCGILKEGREPEAKTVVLTFDDGFRSHLVNVLPILKKYGFPATFFVTADFSRKEFLSAENIPQATMNAEEIAVLARSELADVEPHGITHKELTKMPLAEADKEIRRSKDILEELLNKECTIFAYPRGYFNGRIREIMREAGFKAAVTTIEGLAKGGDDLLVLPRYTVNHRAGIHEFKGYLNYSGVMFSRLRNLILSRG